MIIYSLKVGLYLRYCITLLYKKVALFTSDQWSKGVTALGEVEVEVEVKVKVEKLRDCKTARPQDSKTTRL
jgi:hypothetical protein